MTGPLRTSITRAELEGRALWQWLCSPRAVDVRTVEDIERRPSDLAGWHRATLGRALDWCIAHGAVGDDGHGRLIVAPHPDQEPA